MVSNSSDTLLSLRPHFGPKDYEKMDDKEAPWPPQKNPSYIRSSDQTDQLTPIDPYLYLRGRETIEEDLDHLPKPLHPKRTIYIMHSPPFGTRLDLIQGGKSAGSRSIKTFIEKNQPLLTLHGHIHESPEPLWRLYGSNWRNSFR